MRNGADDDDMFDDMIRAFEADLRRGSPTMTAVILTGLTSILWELARMRDGLRSAPHGPVTGEDRKRLANAFRRMEREAESLSAWLRSCALELPRN
jgi:hypothetical protein